jgi:hypothetical protein
MQSPIRTAAAAAPCNLRPLSDLARSEDNSEYHLLAPLDVFYFHVSDFMVFPIYGFLCIGFYGFFDIWLYSFILKSST